MQCLFTVERVLDPVVTEVFCIIISGVTGEEEKWRYCVEDTNNALSFAVGAMYVRETFHGDSKASVRNIVSYYIHTERQRCLSNRGQFVDAINRLRFGSYYRRSDEQVQVCPQTFGL